MPTRRVQMRTLLVAAIIALMTGSAYCQSIAPMFQLGAEKPHAPVDPEKEKAYKSAIDKVPSRKLDDPWGSVRSNPATPPA